MDPAIPSTGLSLVAEPEYPSLDLIFVHGFTGHPERTWTHTKGDVAHRIEDNRELDEPPPKARKLNSFPFSRARKESSHNVVYWPRELIPDTIPEARVLTYGYDTYIRHKLGPPGSMSAVYDIAWDFLVALEALRREEPLRPAIFVVHSLGGIVVKEMLRRSSGCLRGQAHLRSVFESTIGVMFFGTPHSGADPRGLLHRIAEKVIKAAGFSVNEQIVNTLLPSSERLRELRDEFGPMAIEQNWIIHSFQEQLGVVALGGQKVVEDTSSYLNLPALEICEHIGRNHMDMCRFKGPDDIEYRKASSALRRMTSSVSKQPKRSEEIPLNDEQKRMLLDSLKFDRIDAHQMTVRTAHAKTCKWLLNKSEYLDWLDLANLHKHHGFLWIKGKPGSGKSTLMKFALATARKTMKGRTVISFFFNARGDSLEKSTLGTYRSLLLQLLERFPALQSVFDSLIVSTSIITPSYEWSIESLKILLQHTVQSLGKSSVVCFIDALDECEEDQVRDMMSFFENLSEVAVSAGVQLHVCFSSRHYPHITITRGLTMVLEGQEGHNQDIANYLDSELKIGHSKVAEQIRGELQEKAAGIFMWVVLVVGILNKEYDRGWVHALRRRLHEIPEDLHELFRDILTRDSQNRHKLVLCVQWLLFSRQPLSPEQLYFAILSGVEPESISRWDPEGIGLDTIKRVVLDSSRGLAEITTKTPRAQFIHESVRDFFLIEDGLGSIWPDLRSNFQGQSHDRLKTCCLNYMDAGIAVQINLPGELPAYLKPEAVVLRESTTAAFPLLDYAVRNVLYHADAAEGSGVSQSTFLDKFPRTNWIWLDNLLQNFGTRRHTWDASLLYLLAESNASNLIRIHSSVPSSLEVGTERYGPPLLAALATGSEDAVRVFAEAYAKYRLAESGPHSLCSEYKPTANSRRDIGRGFSFHKSKGLLYYLAELGNEELFALVLRTGLLPPNSTDKDGQTLFFFAALNHHDVIAKLLLETGKVNVNLEDSSGKTALAVAAMGGNLGAVQLLLETPGVDINRRSGASKMSPLLWAAYYGTKDVAKIPSESDEIDSYSRGAGGDSALSLAARQGHERIVELLLKRGAEADSKDLAGCTPLMSATYCGHVGVVRLLLKTGRVDVNSRNVNMETALLLAAKRGHEAILKLLLEEEVEVNSKDSFGRTPLAWAGIRGHVSIAKLLLRTGRVDANLNDKIGRTLLSWAAGEGHVSAAQLLLQTDRVDADSKDDGGDTR